MPRWTAWVTQPTVMQVPTAASTSSIGSTAASVPPRGFGSSVSRTNERAVVRARAPSSHVVTVVKDATPMSGSAATAARVASKADRSTVERLFGTLASFVRTNQVGSVPFPKVLSSAGSIASE